MRLDNGAGCGELLRGLWVKSMVCMVGGSTVGNSPRKQSFRYRRFFGTHEHFPALRMGRGELWAVDIDGSATRLETQKTEEFLRRCHWIVHDISICGRKLSTINLTADPISSTHATLVALSWDCIRLKGNEYTS